MKKDLHPKFYTTAQITCACGNIIKTGSTKENMRVEICSACHPLYTGKAKFIDATGRIDRFKGILAKSKNLKDSRKKKPKKTSLK